MNNFIKPIKLASCEICEYHIHKHIVDDDNKKIMLCEHCFQVFDSHQIRITFKLFNKIKSYRRIPDLLYVKLLNIKFSIGLKRLVKPGYWKMQFNYIKSDWKLKYYRFKYCNIMS